MDHLLNEHYHKLAIDEKSSILSYIYELGEKKLKRLFKFPGENFSFWWFSLIAEKSPYKSDYYEKLILRLISPQNTENYSNNSIYVEFKTILTHIFRGMHYLIYYTLRIIRAKLYIKSFKRRRSSLLSKNHIIISYFPLFDKAKAESNIFENGYLAPFHRVLAKMDTNGYAHICISAKIDGYNLMDAISIANRFNQQQTIFFIEEFAKLEHILLFLFYYIYFMVVFLTNIKFIRKCCLYNYKNRGYDTWYLLKNNFYDSFCGESCITSIWAILLFKELTNRLNKKTKITTICEMQSWEKAVYIFAKKRGITTVGFQHGVLPELLLNYFSVSQEIGGSDFIRKCPVPDYLATIGNIPKKLFMKYAWPQKRVFVWGAQRFENLKGIQNSAINWKDKKDYFVCVFPLDREETQKILLLVNDAFKLPSRYKIFLKGHPAGIENLEKMINRLSLKFSSSNIEITTKPIANILQYSKGIIQTESSSCVYALAYEIPVIVPRFLGQLDCNPFSYVSDIPIYAYSAEELRDICDKIINLSILPISQNKYHEFLEEYLYFPDDDLEYLEKINCLVN